MANIAKINGYYIKDEEARRQIAAKQSAVYIDHSTASSTAYDTATAAAKSGIPVYYRYYDGMDQHLLRFSAYNGDINGTGATLYFTGGFIAVGGVWEYVALTRMTRQHYKTDKVDAVSSSSTDMEIPTAKAVWTQTKNKLDKSSQATKTSAMTQPVGVDSNGKLWTIPGSGGSDLPVTTAILKGNGNGGAEAATTGVDYVTPDYVTNAISAAIAQVDALVGSGVVV